MTNDLKELKQEILSELRVELVAIHLGDDLLVCEEEAARLLGIHPRTIQRILVEDRGRLERLVALQADEGRAVFLDTLFYKPG